MALASALKLLFAPWLYRYPPIGLQPSELGIYLTELLHRRTVPGDVAEVGCSVGGTACVASSLVKRYSPEKNYVCFDTFSGFVKEQFDVDVAAGTPEQVRSLFAANSERLVRRILDIHGCQHVTLVKGDISQMSDSNFAERYSVVLVDVDLAIPTYSALSTFYPRLSPGGIILVDDCRPDVAQRWRAQDGYERFCTENGLRPTLRYGFGVVEANNL
jgi:hypothetical protein